MEMYVTVLLVLIHWTSPSCSQDEEINAEVSNVGNTTLAPLVGESCWNLMCPVNQFCNEFYICECYDGFRNQNGYCVPCAGEFESCTKSEDCCEKLICIKGVCRKVLPSLEFTSLAKICLAITATTVTVAVLSLLLKCLLRYRRFERFGPETDSSSFDSYSRHLMRDRPPPYNLNEKPPSYEECVNSAPSRLYLEPPPPYVISANVPQTAVTNDSCIESSNSGLPTSQDNVITPLNVRALAPVVNSNLPQTQDTKSDKKEES